MFNFLNMELILETDQEFIYINSNAEALFSVGLCNLYLLNLNFIYLFIYLFISAFDLFTFENNDSNV